MADNAGTGEGDRVLRVLMRFGLDEQSAQTISKALDDQESSVADIAKQWDLLRNQVGLSEKETVSAIQGSVTGMKLQEDQILAIVKAYEDKQAAESAAAKQAAADLEAENDRLKQIQENTDLIAQSFTNVLGLGRAEVSLGRGITSLGKLIGNEDITRFGQATTAVGRFTSALGRLPQALQAVREMGDVLQKLAGGGSIAALLSAAGAIAAAAAAALVSAKILDKYNQDLITVTGKSLQEGTTLGAPVFKQLDIAKQGLGFPDIGKALGLQSLSYNAKQAGDEVMDSADKIKLWGEMVNKSTAAVYDAQAEAAGLELDTAKQLRSIGVGDFSMEGLQKALDKNKELLQLRLTEGDTVGSTAAQVSDAIRLIQGAIAGLKAKDPLLQATPGFIEYQDSLKKADQQYGDQRVKIEESTQKQINDITLRYTRQNETAWTNYLKAQRNADERYADQRLKILNSGVEEAQHAEQDYYARRLKAAESYGIEVQRMEEAHQVEMQRLNEDHTKRLRKLADARDALGIEDEMDAYQTERRRKEEDYQRQAAQRNQDYARQLAEMEAAFKEQEKVRKDDRQKQLAELARQKAEDDATRKKDYEAAVAERADRMKEDIEAAKQEGKDKLEQAAQQHTDELNQLNDAWTTRRRQLGLWLAGEQAQFDTYMKARQEDLQKWVDTHLTTTTSTGGVPLPVSTTPGSGTGAGTGPTGRMGGEVPAFAAGGYSGGGLANMHAGEFVTNPQTTRLLEKLVGGQLTQQNLLSAAAGAGAGPITISVNQSFSGQESNPAMYRSIVYETITEVIDKALRQ